MDKKELRKSIKMLISNISLEDREVMSRKVSEHIQSLGEWESADTVLLFNSLPDEIDTKCLIESAIMDGKKVVLPVVNGANLDLYYYNSNNLSVGSFGIVEPTSDSLPANIDDVNLAIIPGRAFTKKGKRLGRGKGFYDRLLPSLRCPMWGICYPCQIVSDIQTDSWDIPMDKVFCE